MNEKHQIRSLCLSYKYNIFDNGGEAFPKLIPCQFIAGEYHAYPTPEQNNKIVYEWIDRAEIAKLHGHDISLAFEKELGIAGAYGINGLGIDLKSFFEYFGGKQNFIVHLKMCRTELTIVCESAEIAKNMYYLFSWVLHVLNDGRISSETLIYEVMPPVNIASCYSAV